MNTDDKVVFDELIREFKIENVETFSNYLTEIWKDLARRSNEKWKGINKITFSKYYGLPGIINDRLFAVFDSNKNEYLDPKEFLTGMTTLFSDNFDQLAKFIFNFYDFDRDGFISKEDVRVVLSYVPIQAKMHSKFSLKYESQDFIDRVEAQDELYSLLNKAFGKKEMLSQDDFFDVIYNVNSDIFLFILLFLLEKRPFNNQTIQIYEGGSVLDSPNPKQSRTPTLGTNTQHVIMSPSLKTKFKSPTLNQRRIQNQIGNSKTNEFSIPILSLYSGKSKQVKVFDKDKDKEKEKDKDKLNEKQIEQASNIRAPHRRERKHLDQLQDKTPPVGFQFSGDIALDSDSDDEIIDSSNTRQLEGITHEGYMFKITKTKKIKRLWFKLVCKDIYYFKTKGDKTHKGMHNLSGVYLKENETVVINGMTLYCFSIIYPKQTRNYYLDNKEEMLIWIKILRKAVNVTPLSENYEIKETVGKGKFGLVKLGIHKETQRKVAIKIMNKVDMTIQDLELVKTEIDILKISQHPNIIKLYDVYENPETIYIIMEYCSGGDLFSYIEQRNYKLPEPRVAEIIHKLAAAIYFIHSFGIVHRDLKPENILMTDKTDKADIRVLDFGLSKIIGPKEKCSEPYGTLSYVAPEVLIEQPYDQRVDLWSIGIITYLLLCGCLPFDDEHSEREIARQTIHDPVPFHTSLWKFLSTEAKSFVDGLLQKKPEKRMTIKQILEHEWIKKYYNKVTEERKKSVDLSKSNFALYASVNLKQKD